jgi:hypothetical protein
VWSFSPRAFAPTVLMLKMYQEEIFELINYFEIIISFIDFQVFEKIGQSYSVVELNDHPNGGQVQAVLKDMTGESTV